MKIICVPDLHAPYHDKAALYQVLQAIKREKPDCIVQLGDAFDLFSMSRFPKSYNAKGVMRPIDEVDEACAVMTEFWRTAQKYSKKSKYIQLLGNHDGRFNKQLLTLIPEAFGVLKLDYFFRFDKVHTHFDLREPYIINNICFEHGFYSKAGDHMKRNQMSTVHGHTHRASITYLKRKTETLFNMECGYLADETSAALSYTKSRWTNWHKAYGIIDEYGPRIVLL